ncbi:hypothetical protein CC1G_06687 [Coprinopsis cinerea okayama7|uniref:Uncharacterized protein n=1 Tax=Coprinopsis cinerea (strain Okayama-7 / 130 / ATCC MYA-4618 / FGSC 9003) TaxID=240176 RepID=A8P811_COPC7|nr:hypothetical protein CC1G_06687 [Coprinopsis cinerea okayama7\|eukprot:XP_001839474.2 hypothetical protein CC1G_06687 [Coprinopsis cinerea okayama7\
MASIQSPGPPQYNGHQSQGARLPSSIVAAGPSTSMNHQQQQQAFATHLPPPAQSITSVPQSPSLHFRYEGLQDNRYRQGPLPAPQPAPPAAPPQHQGHPNHTPLPPPPRRASGTFPQPSSVHTQPPGPHVKQQPSPFVQPPPLSTGQPGSGFHTSQPLPPPPPPTTTFQRQQGPTSAPNSQPGTPRVPSAFTPPAMGPQPSAVPQSHLRQQVPQPTPAQSQSGHGFPAQQHHSQSGPTQGPPAYGVAAQQQQPQYATPTQPITRSTMTTSDSRAIVDSAVATILDPISADIHGLWSKYVNALRAVIEKLHKDYTTQLERERVQISHLQRHIHKLTGEKIKLQSENLGLHARVSHIEQENAKFSVTLAATSDALVKANSTIANLETEKSAIEAKYQALDGFQQDQVASSGTTITAEEVYAKVGQQLVDQVEKKLQVAFAKIAEERTKRNTAERRCIEQARAIALLKHMLDQQSAGNRTATPPQLQALVAAAENAAPGAAGAPARPSVQPPTTAALAGRPPFPAYEVEREPFAQNHHSPALPARLTAPAQPERSPSNGESEDTPIVLDIDMSDEPLDHLQPLILPDSNDPSPTRPTFLGSEHRAPVVLEGALKRQRSESQGQASEERPATRARLEELSSPSSENKNTEDAPSVLSQASQPRTEEQRPGENGEPGMTLPTPSPDLRLHSRIPPLVRSPRPYSTLGSGVSPHDQVVDDPATAAQRSDTQGQNQPQQLSSHSPPTPKPSSAERQHQESQVLPTPPSISRPNSTTTGTSRDVPSMSTCMSPLQHHQAAKATNSTVSPPEQGNGAQLQEPRAPSVQASVQLTSPVERPNSSTASPIVPHRHHPTPTTAPTDLSNQQPHRSAPSSNVRDTVSPRLSTYGNPTPNHRSDPIQPTTTTLAGQQSSTPSRDIVVSGSLASPGPVPPRPSEAREMSIDDDPLNIKPDPDEEEVDQLVATDDEREEGEITESETPKPVEQRGLPSTVPGPPPRPVTPTAAGVGHRHTSSASVRMPVDVKAEPADGRRVVSAPIATATASATATSSSSASAVAGTIAASTPAASVSPKAKPKPPSQLSVMHLPLLYSEINNKMTCRSCMTRPREPGNSQPLRVARFEIGASFAVLSEHIVKEHPIVHEQMLKMSRNQIMEMRQRMAYL